MSDVVSHKANPKFLDFLREEVSSVHEEGINLLIKRRNGATIELLEDCVSEGIISKERGCKLWGDSIDVAYVDPLLSIVTPEAFQTLPVEIAQKAQAIGLYIIDGVMTTAMSDPLDEKMVSRLENISNVKISPVFALPCEILDAININHTSQEGIDETIAQFEKDNAGLLESLDEDNMTNVGELESLSKILEGLLLFAIREKASDIHLESTDEGARVRFRLDGKLRQIFLFSRQVQTAFCARLKVVCKLNLAESRFPQDGRFSMPIGTTRADFRVSIMPTIHGEKSVIRILASTGIKSLMTLDQMLISQNILNPLRRIIQSPNGIFFVTGPTGSGKTTTLYSIIQEINDESVNISTIEDPVELQMEGLTQSQVNPHIDLKFSTILRSLLRQDPDILLVGEIRDAETGKIATEAALTGHLVLSTLHTNNGIQAITRLIDLGIQPYMVAPSVIGVLAQRLLSRICDMCKESYTPSQDICSHYFIDSQDYPDTPFYRGLGCEHCRNTGYRGRVAIHELVLVSEEMRSLIAANAGTQELMESARRLGYRPLRYDALKKALLGLTTIDEVEKHTVVEWEAP